MLTSISGPHLASARSEINSVGGGWAQGQAIEQHLGPPGHHLSLQQHRGARVVLQGEGDQVRHPASRGVGSLHQDLALAHIVPPHTLRQFEDHPLVLRTEGGVSPAGERNLRLSLELQVAAVDVEAVIVAGERNGAALLKDRAGVVDAVVRGVVGGDPPPCPA